MSIDQIKTSEAFRKSTFHASLAIVQFVIIYFLLICGAVLLTALCVLGAYSLIAIRFTGITVLLGAALLTTAFFVFFFLLKFIFKRNVVDRSDLTELFEKDQPELFDLISQIVKEVQTDFPKKVYLSSDVNAAVFYDSSFWSMFLPVRKNLVIGMGLVNTVTVSEFKGILAHEFGHFSQRSMKVGSYVYNVNYVIHNMLFDNASFDTMLEKWGDGNGYLQLGSTLAKLVIKGIQWVLGKAYNIVNLNYLSLSREMEFHADEVAAHVAGPAPLAAALRRFELADHALTSVSNFYHQENIQAVNIYPHHLFVMNFLAEKDKLAIKNGLPVMESNQNRYNKSKLVIANQWASHPSMDDRVARLMQLNQDSKPEDNRKASEIFRRIDDIQEAITLSMFQTMERGPSNETVVFEQAFVDQFNLYVLNEMYNGYYDSKNPVFPEEPSGLESHIDPTELFTEELVEMVYTEIAIQSDIQAIEAINEGIYQIKSFDYDGNKYTADEAAFLLPNLRNELTEIQQLIAENDTRIYQFFQKTAQQQNKHAELEKLIETFEKVNEDKDAFNRFYTEIANTSGFFLASTPLDEIEAKLAELSETEARFKKQLIEVQNDPFYIPNITEAMRETFEKYIQNATAYFSNGTYHEEVIELMRTAMQEYIFLWPVSQFRHKKQLLDFLAELYNAHQPANIAS